jgi:hypothetical protein
MLLDQSKLLGSVAALALGRVIETVSVPLVIVPVAGLPSVFSVIVPAGQGGFSFSAIETNVGVTDAANALVPISPDVLTIASATRPPSKTIKMLLRRITLPPEVETYFPACGSYLSSR